MAADGLITVPGSFGPKETMHRLETEVTAKGLTIFARIDHAAGAAQVDLGRPNFSSSAMPKLARCSCNPARRSVSICRSKL
jgi:hypothetical protein